MAENAARRSLAGALQVPGLSSPAAMRQGRAHGLWNFFGAVPPAILAVEALAGWTRPDVFAGIGPAATRAEINRRFAALPSAGCFRAGLPPATQR
ncbi:hypothetical protein [Teichococcus vastitatis]|uniref:Uncharacterized protein n=1 Tax=Teichococcus vastitatis TaxID=2307076 RepID=A0ABS9WBB9_9PROT|nr:hypothetical protein [Pseudoroseomonas vastitatis]MCI0756584.1 hypothetical protein [Pseudoroseomonas vastitatis]